MATRWSRNVPYEEKELKALCENGNVTQDSKAGEVFKKYNHCCTPVKLANFRKNFRG